MHFSFKTIENFSNSKPRPPGLRKESKSPTPGIENVQISGGRQGGGWSGLEPGGTLKIFDGGVPFYGLQ